jgi:hypothetical protein
MTPGSDKQDILDGGCLVFNMVIIYLDLWGLREKFMK